MATNNAINLRTPIASFYVRQNTGQTNITGDGVPFFLVSWLHRYNWVLGPNYFEINPSPYSRGLYA